MLHFSSFLFYSPLLPSPFPLAFLLFLPLSAFPTLSFLLFFILSSPYFFYHFILSYHIFPSWSVLFKFKFTFSSFLLLFRILFNCFFYFSISRSISPYFPFPWLNPHSVFNVPSSLSFSVTSPLRFEWFSFLFYWFSYLQHNLCLLLIVPSLSLFLLLLSSFHRLNFFPLPLSLTSHLI